MLKNVPSYNGGAIITGVLCIGLLLGMKHINERFKSKLKFPIPAELVVVSLPSLEKQWRGDAWDREGVVSAFPSSFNGK